MSDEKGEFRQILGQYPTGVCAITAISDGSPVGMVVGTFTSVSMDPPIVGFLPARTSSTWPRIKEAGSFCVNVLAYDQEDECRALSTSGGDKFASISWVPAKTGSPVLPGAMAWIDCTIREVVDAGDHLMVLGDVVDLKLGPPSLPLVFFRGGYGRFSSGPLVAETIDDAASLKLVNAVRDQMQTVAAQLGLEASATGYVGGRLALIATTWSPFSDRTAVRAGDRVPFRPPLAVPVAAWADDEMREEWLSSAPEEQRGELEAVLNLTRERGWAVSVRPDPRTNSIARMLDANLRPEKLAKTGDVDQRNLSVPVFGADGSVAVSLAVSAMTPAQADTELEDIADQLILAARRAERKAFSS